MTHRCPDDESEEDSDEEPPAMMKGMMQGGGGTDKCPMGGPATENEGTFFVEVQKGLRTLQVHYMAESLRMGNTF